MRWGQPTVASGLAGVVRTVADHPNSNDFQLIAAESATPSITHRLCRDCCSCLNGDNHADG